MTRHRSSTHWAQVVTQVFKEQGKVVCTKRAPLGPLLEILTYHAATIGNFFLTSELNKLYVKSVGG